MLSLSTSLLSAHQFPQTIKLLKCFIRFSILKTTTLFLFVCLSYSLYSLHTKIINWLGFLSIVVTSDSNKWITFEQMFMRKNIVAVTCSNTYNNILNNYNLKTVHKTIVIVIGILDWQSPRILWHQQGPLSTGQYIFGSESHGTSEIAGNTIPSSYLIYFLLYWAF